MNFRRNFALEIETNRQNEGGQRIKRHLKMFKGKFTPFKRVRQIINYN